MGPPLADQVDSEALRRWNMVPQTPGQLEF